MAPAPKTKSRTLDLMSLAGRIQHAVLTIPESTRAIHPTIATAALVSSYAQSMAAKIPVNHMFKWKSHLQAATDAANASEQLLQLSKNKVQNGLIDYARVSREGDNCERTRK